MKLILQVTICQKWQWLKSKGIFMPEIKAERKWQLILSEKEALFLKILMQNPLQENESADERALRQRVWDEIRPVGNYQ